MGISWFRNIAEKIRLSVGNKYETHAIKENQITINQYYISSGPIQTKDLKDRNQTPSFILGFGDEYPIVVDVRKTREVLMGDKWGNKFTGRFTANISREGLETEKLVIHIETKDIEQDPDLIERMTAFDLADYVFGEAYKKFGDKILPEVVLVQKID